MTIQVCEICRDPFEQFYDDDEEEWHLRDAVRIDGRTYHPVCYEDYKEVCVFHICVSYLCFKHTATSINTASLPFPFVFPSSSILFLVLIQVRDICTISPNHVSCYKKNKYSKNTMF